MRRFVPSSDLLHLMTIASRSVVGGTSKGTFKVPDGTLNVPFPFAFASLDGLPPDQSIPVAVQSGLLAKLVEKAITVRR